MGNLVLITGVSGTGKTVSSGTFPGKKLYLDYDNGLKSLFHAKNNGSLVVPDSENVYSVQFYGEEYFPLDLEIGVTDKKSTAPEHTKNAQTMFTKYNEVMAELRKDQCVPARMLTRGYKDSDERVGPFQTVVLDTLTNMWRVWKDSLLAKRKRATLDISDYGVTEGLLFKQFIPGLKSLAIMMPEDGWVILLDHEMIEKDELTGKVWEFPVGPSKNQGRGLSAEFDEVWRQVYDNGYFWRTKNHGRFEGAKSRLDLPDKTEASYKKLKELIK